MRVRALLRSDAAVIYSLLFVSCCFALFLLLQHTIITTTPQVKLGGVAIQNIKTRPQQKI